MQGMLKVQVLRAACCVAGADGLTEPTEQRIVDMLAHEVGVGQASLEAMLSRATSEDDYVEDQFRILKADPKETMRLLFSVALADGQLEDKELNVLRRIATKLEVNDDAYQQWLREARGYLSRDDQPLSPSLSPSDELSN